MESSPDIIHDGENSRHKNIITVYEESEFVERENGDCPEKKVMV